MSYKSNIIRFAVLCAVFQSLALSPVVSQTAETLFISMPEELMPSISENIRQEMSELFKSGLNSEIENNFEDTCKVLSLTDDYLKIKNGSGMMEMIVLTLANDSKVICLIQTDCVPVCDSYIEFYSLKWKQLDASLFITPAEKAHFVKKEFSPDDNRMQNALVPLDISLMKFSYDNEKRQLYQYFETPKYLNESEMKAVKPYLSSEPAVFVWNKMRFELM
ncbi:MAG: DUF3256 family protein [Dysgonamonadaceae bacterium]|jgi:hypothetical protein|nr:DUF3256 family protein [Dysgonamonadaceae bacterium]